LSSGSGVLFNVIAVILLSYSVQTLGFLFTISMLFLPTTLLAHLRVPGLKKHFLLSVLLSSLSAAAGFILSLRFTQIPTVPTIIILQFALGLLVLGLEWINALLRRNVSSTWDA
jgi:ABC-type Mn2+/Zn2+ transport system permease subunit